MHIISFGGVSFPDANGEQQIPVAARSNLTELRNGAYDIDGSKLWLRPSQISISFWFQEDGMDTNIDELMGKVAEGRNVLVAEMRDHLSRRYTYAKLSSMQREAIAESYLCWQPITLRFEQSFPFWINAEDGWTLDSGYTLDSGMTLDGKFYSTSMIASPLPITITYEGVARGVLGKIVFVPRTSSSITDITIENYTNQMMLQWEGTVAAEKTLVIDFLGHTATNDGEAAVTGITTPDKQTEWMALMPGDNSLQIDATLVGTVDIYYQYKRLYL